jgi:dynein heavy chain
MGALIVIDVHALDVIGRLVTNKVDNVEEFDWISQLRYYWEDDECWVKCI